ncbi:hypothetical protein CYMTET_30805 [Cymbomonas tetramitiformis]|uniref:Uncharacterized protein n=1 Tax=Cymbomonas tetramitiformis TaxID=36881 RepID=A0AAE0FJK9_9CHLO|nr:hypothetical protein CYMTET_30805 [Cymbomonas tetramitiformis]
MKGAPYQSPGRKVGDEKLNNPGQQAAAAIHRVEEAAKNAARKTAGKADGGTIPQEVTNTLSDLAQQLKSFHDELPAGIQKLRELQLAEDVKTAERHKELLICLGSVITAHKESTEALTKEIQRTTWAVKTLADVLAVCTFLPGDWYGAPFILAASVPGPFWLHLPTSSSTDVYSFFPPLLMPARTEMVCVPCCPAAYKASYAGWVSTQ